MSGRGGGGGEEVKGSHGQGSEKNGTRMDDDKGILDRLRSSSFKYCIKIEL